MSNGPVYISPVARAVPFGPAPGFVANNVEDGIIESQKTLLTTFLQATSTVSTTSATYGTIADMTITPPSGKGIIFFTANFRSRGVNTLGNIALFVNGTIVNSTIRQCYDNAAILGLVTLSTNEGACSVSIVYEAQFNGTDVVTIRFNETQGGTTYVDGRSLLFMSSGL